jgi:hypothetical protein
MTAQPPQRPNLTLVQSELDVSVEWSWFCGHCAAPSPDGQAPAPAARVCRSCSLGLLLEAPSDVIPTSRDAFLVVDSALLVQAMSRKAEVLLDRSEEVAVRRPVRELLVPAEAEAESSGAFAQAIADAIGGGEQPASAFVRPWNTFGVRIRARIAPCGPPRAALLVLDAQLPRLRAVES